MDNGNEDGRYAMLASVAQDAASIYRRIVHPILRKIIPPILRKVISPYDAR